jgi:hypothetical protein
MQKNKKKTNENPSQRNANPSENSRSVMLLQLSGRCRLSNKPAKVGRVNCIEAQSDTTTHSGSPLCSISNWIRSECCDSRQPTKKTNAGLECSLPIVQIALRLGDLLSDKISNKSRYRASVHVVGNIGSDTCSAKGRPPSAKRSSNGTNSARTDNC